MARSLIFDHKSFTGPQGSCAEGYIRGRHAVVDAALQSIDPGTHRAATPNIE